MLPSDLKSLVRSWPQDAPLACLATAVHDHAGGMSLAASPTKRLEFTGEGAFEALQKMIPGTIGGSSNVTGRGWMLCLSYELGRVIEPAAGPQQPTRWPLVTLLRCEGSLVQETKNGAWARLGDERAIPLLNSPSDSTCATGTLEPTISRATYESQVQAVIELIHAGDCFQANIAQRFSCPFSGSVRSLACAAFDAAKPQFGALLETAPGRAVISMSPELFLDASAGEIRTRPIKGTRPSNVDPSELISSSKDAAELAMIVDLMRNDLGRICAPGTIRVVTPRSIESTTTVHHAVAEVQGTLNRHSTLSDLLRATFPPGSITGAPKIRAMQIIQQLEAEERGPYCGAIGWLDDSGRLILNVAIRTIAASGVAGATSELIDGRLDYFAGCGIVAESTPAEEYDESMTKAAVFQQTLHNINQDDPSPAVPSLGVEVLDVAQCSRQPAPPECLGETR